MSRRPAGCAAWRREDWLAGQAARCRMAAMARQPKGLGLFARRPASSLRRGRTSTPRSSEPSPSMDSPRVPSFFLGLRANSSRRGPRGDFEQTLRALIRADAAPAAARAQPCRLRFSCVRRDCVAAGSRRASRKRRRLDRLPGGHLQTGMPQGFPVVAHGLLWPGGHAVAHGFRPVISRIQ